MRVDLVQGVISPDRDGLGTGRENAIYALVAPCRQRLHGPAGDRLGGGGWVRHT
ncbi:MAG: hypothetical protein ABF636_02440 [Acetobacter sp.]